LCLQLSSLDAARDSLSEALSAVESVDRAHMQQISSSLQEADETNRTRMQQQKQQYASDIAALEQYLDDTGLISPSIYREMAHGPEATSTNPSSPWLPAPTPTSSSSASNPPTPASICRFLRHSNRWTHHAQELTLHQPIKGEDMDEQLRLVKLPNQFKDEEQKLKQFHHLLSLVKVKDELVRFAMSSRKGLVSEQQHHAANLRKLYDAAQRELDEWMRVAQKMQQQVQANKAKCAFCGTAMSAASASSVCTFNTASNKYVPVDGAEVSERREGDGMHYFVPIG